MKIVQAIKSVEYDDERRAYNYISLSCDGQCLAKYVRVAGTNEQCVGWRADEFCVRVFEMGAHALNVEPASTLYTAMNDQIHFWILRDFVGKQARRAIHAFFEAYFEDKVEVRV